MEDQQHQSLMRRQMSNSGISPTIIDDMMTNNSDETINSLLLKKMDSMRTANVILEVFSLLAVLGIIARIMYDAKKTSDLKVSLRPQKFALLHSVHIAERVALIIASIIALQQIIFVGVGASAMGSLMATNCDQTAQAVVPFVLIVPYTFLVFGVETTYRSLLRDRFRPHHKWTFPICLGSIAALTFITWIPTAVEKHSDLCRGSLVWWTSGHGTAVMVMLTLLMVSCLTMAVVIALQLLKSIKTEPNYRIAASRVVYYLIFIVVLVIFILPFYARASAGTLPDDSTTAEIASVMLSISGILFAAWHVFDRANCYQLAFRPKETPWQGRQQIRIFGPNDLDRSRRPPSPADDVPLNSSTDDLTASDIKYNYFKAESTRSITPPIPMAEKVLSSQGPVIPPLTSTSSLMESLSAFEPSSGVLPPPAKSNVHQRNKPSYSLFPVREAQNDMDEIKYPAPVRSSRNYTTMRTSMIERQNGQLQGSSVPHTPWLYHEQPPGSPFSIGQNFNRESSSSKQTVEVGLFLEPGTPSTNGEISHSSWRIGRTGKAPIGSGNISLSQLSGGPKMGAAPSQSKAPPTISRRPVNNEPTFAALSNYRISKNIRPVSSLRMSMIAAPPPPPTTSLPALPTLSRPLTSFSNSSSAPPPSTSASNLSSLSLLTTAPSSSAASGTAAPSKASPKSRQSKDLPPLPLSIRKQSVSDNSAPPPRLGNEQRSNSSLSVHRAGLGLRLNPVNL